MLKTQICVTRPQCVKRMVEIILCLVDPASRYNRVKKNQLDAQLILSIFRQPLHVSGVSIFQHQEVQPYVYNNWYLLFFLDDCLLSWLDWFQSNQDNRQSGCNVRDQMFMSEDNGRIKRKYTNTKRIYNH